MTDFFQRFYRLTPMLFKHDMYCSPLKLSIDHPLHLIAVKSRSSQLTICMVY